MLAGSLPPAFGCARTHRGLCEEQVRLQCELAYRCCTEANERFAVLPAALTAYATSEGECIDRLRPSCRAQDPLDDAVELGRMDIDQDLAALCVDALAAARDACDVAAFDKAFEITRVPAAAGDELDAPCAYASRGNVENEGACAVSAECAPGGFCDFTTSPPSFDDDIAAFDGSCVAPGLAGEACASVGCAAGLFCRISVCALLPDDGEPCPEFVCADGNLCNADSVCEAFPDIGEPCEFQCAAGAFCVASDEVGELGTCARQRAPGEACVGAFNECANNETCLNGNCTGIVEAVCTGTP